jgi:HTH-type transcriptional regulator/antitoxin HigA
MTAVDEREYAELLREHHPRVIRSKVAYNKALREIEVMAIRGKERTTAETEYYRVLCALAADYERSVEADQWPKVSPLDALRELMELKGVTQSALAAALGDRGAASSILSGRRQISKGQARKLADLFGVHADFFI